MATKNKLVKLFRIFILLGTIMVCLNIIYQDHIVSFIVEEQIGSTNMTWYRLNTFEYIQNIRNTVQDTTYLEFKDNPLHWVDTGDDITSWYFWNAFGNNACFILNYIIMGLNILIYPLKVGGYVLCVLLSIMGVIIEDNPTKISWLTELATTFRNMWIEYMQGTIQPI